MWNLKKNSLLEGRSIVLATKGENGVWLDVGKSAEPRGERECVRGSPFVSVHYICTPPCCTLYYIWFCQHTVAFKTNDKRIAEQKHTVRPWVYYAALRFRLESLHFCQMSWIHFFLTYCTTQLTEMWFNGPFQST